MSLNFLYVMIGGSLGAMTRYGLSVFIKRIAGWEFPLATFLINITGSFLLGAFLAADLTPWLQLFAGVGFMGSFTTFSTYQLENLKLWQNKQYKRFLFYMFGSIIFCLLAAMIGYLSFE